MRRHPEVSKRMAYLLKAQNGKYAHCQLSFLPYGDMMEVYPRIPRSQSGADTYLICNFYTDIAMILRLQQTEKMPYREVQYRLPNY